MAVILDSTWGRRGHKLQAIMALFVCLRVAEGLRISGFRVPSYVPITLPQLGGPARGPTTRHPLELAKPILFDCDYDYQPEEDARLAVRWFRNKEPEPFYQWLPELDERHLADWIRPLVNQSFVSDPLDPMKRYRSLLIKRLSMNLTGSYTCLVSSLAGQDSRQAQLVVYQPPTAFTFVQRVYPPPSLQSKAPPAGAATAAAAPTTTTRAPSPTQFRGQAPVVRPPNNLQHQHQHQNQSQRLVYTHDGRPIGRRSRRQISAWQLERRLGAGNRPKLESHIQLHHFECHASQVSPRPVLVLTVKRNQEAIAQYLHEASTTTLRPRQVNAADYYGEHHDQPLVVTLYDITVSATVALNVSMPAAASTSTSTSTSTSGAELGATTVLQFRRGQRMSFECQLEITGTEFEQRKRIQVNDEEVYQFAELEDRKRQQQQQQQQQQRQQEPPHQLLGQEQLQQQRPASSSFHLGPQLAGLLSLPLLLPLLPLDHRI